MAYAQPPRDGRSPPDHVHEASRSSWSTTYSHRPPPYQAPHMHSSTSTLAPLDHMDPESSDSDISRTGEDPYRITSPPAMPVQLPPPPPKHILESADNVQTRLRELTQVEDHNIRKQEMLLAKRRRKDDKIARKREMQDRKIKAIMDARERRDARIIGRRAREDAAFRAVDDQIEEEEMSLRRRLKRLKRGLPLDESHQHGRSTSTISMSPPGPAFSTVPPPPKRHQSGPPSHLDNIRPHQQANFPPPPPNPTPTPSYSFAQSGQPYNAASHAGPSYITLPPAGPPPPQQTAPPPSASGLHDRSPYAINGRPASPAPRPHLHSSATSSQNTPPANPPSRQPSSTYDTRPPPSTSGFAAINAPTTSGFAAINPRSAATPPGSYSSLAKPADVEANRTPASGPFRDQPFNYLPSQRANSGNDGTPTSNHAGSNPVIGKRTPSTTHPYQMSEAFANRHHHCERVDSLNRGIWTSHGPGGTQENPTGPAIEMYLRCNHDDCRRIDWRTVHGLQCHIVKNHEQPKGTIGSLEKALDRYGVPIREVEEYEREHGEGTGGTMADPKNLKIKNKTREAVHRKSTPASYGVDPTARPAGYKPPPGVQESPTIANTTPRSSTGSVVRRSYVQEESTYSDTDDSGSVPTVLRKSGPGPSTSRFEAVGVDRPSGLVNVPAYPRAGVDPNHQLQGDAVMKDAVPSSSWKHWAPTTRAAEAAPKSNSFSPPNSSHTISSGSVPHSSIPSSTAAPVLTAPSIIPSTQTQAMVEEVKKVEEKQAMEDKTFATPNATQSQDTDTQMTGVSETQPTVETSQEPTVDGEKKKDTEEGQSLQTALDSTNGLVPVDGEQSKVEIDGLHDTEPKDDADAITGPAKATRAAFQSPTMTNKPLDPPRSAKRISGRSSAARKLSGDSTDGQTDMAKSADGVDREMKDYEKDPSTRDGSTKGGMDEDLDGDSITVAPSRGSLRKKRGEAMRASLEELESNTPPKRNANGRFTRKRTLV